MSPSAADAIAALTLQQIWTIARRDSRCVRIRWANDPQFWRDVLVAAQAGDERRLAQLHLHAKLILRGELAQLPK